MCEALKELFGISEDKWGNYHGHPKFYKILEQMAELHSKKNKDYATKEDPLRNFKRAAEWAKKYKLITDGYESVKVAIIYMLKQLDAAFKLLGDNQKGEVEGFIDRMMDIAIYSVLIMILYEEDESK